MTCMKIFRRLLINARFVQYLLWEFRWAFGVFWTLAVGGGFLLWCFYHHRPLSYAEACYTVFLLIFLESANLEFPDEWYLQAAFFLLPIVGLGAIADSVVRLAHLVFAQKSKLPEWQRLMASLHRDHIIVLGVGKVGIRIIKGLVTLREQVVAIERKRESLLLDEVRDLDVPVITGDGRSPKVLEQAGVRVARAIILATDDDLANLDGALTARDLNPQIRVVVRLFDDTLATKVGGAFNMPAISTSQVAAPAFIAAATGRKVYQEFQLDNQQVNLVDLTIHPAGKLIGRTVGDIQADTLVNIVMHRGPAGVNVNPGHDIVLGPNDTVLVIAPMNRLLELEAANQPVT